jgi:hypothetical protein
MIIVQLQMRKQALTIATQLSKKQLNVAFAKIANVVPFFCLLATHLSAASKQKNSWSVKRVKAP